jgi:hypothetical protein
MTVLIGCLLAATTQAAPVSFDFAAGATADGWKVTGQAAAAKVSDEADRARDGKPTLACSYLGQAGSPFSLSKDQLDLAGVQSLSLSLKASSQAPLVLSLTEEDGSNYHTFVTCPAGQWCDAAMPLSDLQLQDSSTDENTTLDAEQVRTFTIQELANMPGDLGAIFGTKTGEQWLCVGQVRFGAEEAPSHARVEKDKVLIEDFGEPEFRLLPVGGAQLSKMTGADGKENSALAVRFTFQPDGPQAWPGVVLPTGHAALAGMRALRLRAKPQGPAKLHVLLEEQDGSKYETITVIPEANDWQARDLALADFTLEKGGTDDNTTLDLDHVRVLIVVIDAWNALLDEKEQGEFGLDDVLFLK